MPPTETELVRSMAFISMMVSFTQGSQDVMPVQIDLVESVARLIHAVLQTVGDTHYMASFLFLWNGLTVALMEMEGRYFPDQPIEAPNAINYPARWQPLSVVAADSWRDNRRFVIPAHRALERIFHWIRDQYCETIHSDIMSMVSDGLLLIETVAAFCEIDLKLGPFPPTA